MNKKKIKAQQGSINMNRKRDDKYPVFCFKYLQPYSYNKCSNPSFFIEFLERLKKLASLGWNGINTAQRHSFGTEKIPVKQLIPNSLPAIVTEDVEELTVFRATGNNLPFLGLRVNDTFQIVFIEANFGDIYSH